jgi:hypothetical protein
MLVLEARLSLTLLSGEEPDMAQPYDVYAKLEDPMGVLSVAIVQWEERDDSKPRPEVRRAANTAMDQIDAMLAELHRMRSRLVGEIRASDEATAARADALLAIPRW